MNRIGWCCVEWDITFFDYEVAQKKYNEKRCIAVFSLAYSFNAAGQGNQWSFKATVKRITEGALDHMPMYSVLYK